MNRVQRRFSGFAQIKEECTDHPDVTGPVVATSADEDSADESTGSRADTLANISTNVDQPPWSVVDYCNKVMMANYKANGSIRCICGFSWRTPPKPRPALSHLLTHSTQEYFSCRYCLFSAKRLQRVRDHLKVAHGFAMTRAVDFIDRTEQRPAEVKLLIDQCLKNTAQSADHASGSVVISKEFLSSLVQQRAHVNRSRNNAKPHGQKSMTPIDISNDAISGQASPQPMEIENSIDPDEMHGTSSESQGGSYIREEGRLTLRVGLIKQAILSAPDKRMTMLQIYKWIERNAPWFATWRGVLVAPRKWKKRIRRYLSTYSCFKTSKEPDDRLCYWTIDRSTGPLLKRRSSSASDEITSAITIESQTTTEVDSPPAQSIVKDKRKSTASSRRNSTSIKRKQTSEDSVASTGASADESETRSSTDGSCENHVDMPKKSIDQRKRPSNIEMLKKAILSSPGKRMTVIDIYKWVEKNAAWFMRGKGDQNGSRKWKKRVMYYLSMHNCFKSVRRPRSKMSWWMVDQWANGRRRSQECSHRRDATGKRSSRRQSTNEYYQYQELEDSNPAEQSAADVAPRNLSIQKLCPRARVIKKAILSSPNKRMTVAEIHEWAEKNAPWMMIRRGQILPPRVWKKRINETLSAYSCFKAIKPNSNDCWLVETVVSERRSKRPGSDTILPKSPQPKIDTELDHPESPVQQGITVEIAGPIPVQTDPGHTEKKLPTLLPKVVRPIPLIPKPTTEHQHPMPNTFHSGHQRNENPPNTVLNHGTANMWPECFQKLPLQAPSELFKKPQQDRKILPFDQSSNLKTMPDISHPANNNDAVTGHVGCRLPISETRPCCQVRHARFDWLMKTNDDAVPTDPEPPRNGLTIENVVSLARPLSVQLPTRCSPIDEHGYLSDWQQPPGAKVMCKNGPFLARPPGYVSAFRPYERSGHFINKCHIYTCRACFQIRYTF